MSLFGRTNFALTQVATLYTAANTVIALAAGEGTKLPAPSTDGPFPLGWWDDTTYPGNPNADPNREVTLCVSHVAGADTITVSRGAESAKGGGAASTKNTSGSTYRMALFLTAGGLDQIEDRLVDTIRVTSATHGFYTPASHQLVAQVASLEAYRVSSGFVVPGSGSGTEIANELLRQAVPKMVATLALSGQVVTRFGYNLGAVSSISTGIYTITFSRAMANVNYAVAFGVANALAIGTGQDAWVDIRSKLATGFGFTVRRTDTASPVATAAELYVTVWGDQ